MAKLEPFEVIMRIDFAGSDGLEIVAHAEKVAELVRCKDCKNYGTDGNLLNCKIIRFQSKEERGLIG